MNIFGKKVMSRILILLVSLLFTLSAVAQSFSKKQLDSLEKLLPITPEGTKKVDLLCSLTRGYDGIDSAKPITMVTRP
ncbi:MAG: hypothetical protein AAFY00_13925 [Bacteroidota bacterium]